MAGIKYSDSTATMYTKTSEKLKKLLKILDIACLKITPTLTIWPPSIISYITYFATDLGESAFELPLPVW